MKIIILMLFLCVPLEAQELKINWFKTGALVTSLCGSYLEATKEQDKLNTIQGQGYHEIKYAATFCFATAGFVTGINFSRDKKPVGKYILRTVGLMLINWVFWEQRYAKLAGDLGTYNGWPFKNHWLDQRYIPLWDVGRLLVGGLLYLLN